MSTKARQLDSRPGTSTKRQRQIVACMARQRGIIEELRGECGGSIRNLSCADASRMIARLGGGPLPNPPGGKRPPKRRPAEGTVAMITSDQVEQLERLGFDYFGGTGGVLEFSDWLAKNFKVHPPGIGNPKGFFTGEELRMAIQAQIRLLATAKRAGQVLYVLNGMHKRRQQSRPPAAEEGAAT